MANYTFRLVVLPSAILNLPLTIVSVTIFKAKLGFLLFKHKAAGIIIRYIRKLPYLATDLHIAGENRALYVSYIVGIQIP